MRVDLQLDQNLESFVAELVSTGRYASEEDVLRDGLRLMREREQRLTELDRAIERGIADADAGRVKTLDEARDILLARYRTVSEP